MSASVPHLLPVTSVCLLASITSVFSGKQKFTLTYTNSSSDKINKSNDLGLLVRRGVASWVAVTLQLNSPPLLLHTKFTTVGYNCQHMKAASSIQTATTTKLHKQTTSHHVTNN